MATIEENTEEYINTEQPLKLSEKILAGLLLIFFTMASFFTLMAYWPNRVTSGGCNVYQNKLFEINLIATDCNSQTAIVTTTATNKQPDQAVKKEEVKDKPAAVAVKPLTGQAKLDSIKKADAVARALAAAKALEKSKNQKPQQKEIKHADVIPLNSLILILVAAGGFLGNMIYVSKSFTAFVGSGRFKRQWLLWYFVKPFTAMGLALIVYLALNSDADAAAKGVNINSIVAVAALTGLFTDIAMIKLRDIFEVIVRPSEDKTLKQVPTVKIDLKNIKPAKIDVNQLCNIEIPGENLDVKKLVIMFDGKEIKDARITSKLIRFSYEVPVADRGKTEFEIEIKDEAGKELGKVKIGV